MGQRPAATLRGDIGGTLGAATSASCEVTLMMLPPTAPCRTDLDPGEWDRVIAVNLTGMFHLGQQAARQMRVRARSLMPVILCL
jgi:NAD(P)-dependent dehydrogenase (short-subunit alcohol dehydrogenase family)